MVKQILDAYANRDTLTRRRRSGTETIEVDEMYDSSVFRELITYMMEDPREHRAPASQLLFVAKNLSSVSVITRLLHR